MVDFYKYFNGQGQKIACVARSNGRNAEHPGLDALFQLAVGSLQGRVSPETIQSIAKVEAGLKMYPLGDLQANQNLLKPDERTIVAAVFPGFHNSK